MRSVKYYYILKNKSIISYQLVIIDYFGNLYDKT